MTISIPKHLISLTHKAGEAKPKKFYILATKYGAKADRSWGAELNAPGVAVTCYPLILGFSLSTIKVY